MFTLWNTILQQKEQTTDTHKNVDESHTHQADWKNWVQQTTHCMIPFMLNSRTDKSYVWRKYLGVWKGTGINFLG